jgi:hypothetical protein
MNSKRNPIQDGLDMFSLSGGSAHTPSGLVVPASAIDGLIKAEAKRLAQTEENQWPRLFSKHMLAQNMIAQGAREKTAGTPSFELLQTAARKSFIDALLIRARIDQQKGIWQQSMSNKDIGFRVVHERYKDPEFSVTDEIRRRCEEMEAIFNDPTPVQYMHLYPHGVRVHGGLKDFISRVVKAELVIDRKAMFRYKRANGKGYAAFHWIPGETVRPIHEAVRAWAKKNEKNGQVNSRTLDRFSSATGIDFANNTYCQLVDGEITRGFTEDEVSIHIANPSDELNRWGYGESRLETSLDLTALTLDAWNYNRSLFDPKFPESILTVSGDYDKLGIEAFKQQLHSEVGRGKHDRLPILPGAEGFKIEAHKLRDAPKDMQFDQLLRMLVALKCAAYGAHPTIINFSVDQGNGGGTMFGQNTSADEIKFSKEHGLLPALADMCEWLTNAIVKPEYSDLRLILTGINEENEKETIELLTSRTKNHLTRNEARKADNQEPIGDETDTDNPWNYPSDAPMATTLGAIAQKKQLEAMGQEGQGEELDPMGDDDPDFDEEEQQQEPEVGGQEFVEPDPEQLQPGGQSKEPTETMQKSSREEKYLYISLED